MGKASSYYRATHLASGVHLPCCVSIQLWTAKSVSLRLDCSILHDQSSIREPRGSAPIRTVRVRVRWLVVERIVASLGQCLILSNVYPSCNQCFYQNRLCLLSKRRFSVESTSEHWFNQPLQRWVDCITGGQKRWWCISLLPRLAGCSGCTQSICYTRETAPLVSGVYYSSVCCNYYLSDGICTTECPSSYFPDANRTCGKNGFSCWVLVWGPKESARAAGVVFFVDHMS